MRCHENSCCRYIRNGITKLAFPGTSFNDGCNNCQCLSVNGGEGIGACTRRSCPTKCHYKNWDKVSGWVDRKTNGVEVFDAKAGCRRVCNCVEDNRGRATLDCSADRLCE